MSKKVKLVADVPEPPKVTEEVRKQLEREAREWAKDFQRKKAAIETITLEDWESKSR